MNNAYLSRNEILDILQIAGNFSHRDKLSMKDLIHVLFLFEDKERTEKERQDFLNNLDNG